MYVNREEALGLGLTHEGTMFGLPVWMGQIHTSAPMICPKFQPGRFWLALCDFVCDCLTYVVPSDYELDTMTVIGPIK